MLDDVELWVSDHYGKITTASVDFPQFGWSITSVVVRVMDGVEIGMGQSRQLAIHDLYLRLTSRPTLETQLPAWWQSRFESSR
jgi:hypothetical protein